MNNSRVDYAIQILQTAPKPGKFDMTVWANLLRKERERLGVGAPVMLNGCGTAGCAIGWIASDPLVIQDGLRLEMRDSSGYIVPVYEDEVDVDAAAAYFEIDLTIAEILFYPESYKEHEMKNPAYVIERMQLLLAAGEEVFLQMMHEADIYG